MESPTQEKYLRSKLLDQNFVLSEDVYNDHPNHIRSKGTFKNEGEVMNHPQGKN